MLIDRLFSSIISLFFTCVIKLSSFSAACCNETSGVQVNRNSPSIVPNERCAESTAVNDCHLVCFHTILLFPVWVKKYTVVVRTACLWIITLMKKKKCFSTDVKVLPGTNGTSKVNALLYLHFSYPHVFINENKINYTEQSVMFLTRKAQVPKWRCVSETLFKDREPFCKVINYSNPLFFKFCARLTNWHF